MDFQLTEEQRAVRSLARDFSLKELVPYAEEWEGEAVFHREIVEKMGAQGLYGCAFPEDVGGNGMGLLAQVVGRLHAAGFRVGNVDVVVAAERPQLGPRIAEMQANLSGVVGAVVSVKPKFGEGVGAIGRGEAVAVWAISLISPQADQ